MNESKYSIGAIFPNDEDVLQGNHISLVGFGKTIVEPASYTSSPAQAGAQGTLRDKAKCKGQVTLLDAGLHQNDDVSACGEYRLGGGFDGCKHNAAISRQRNLLN